MKGLKFLITLFFTGNLLSTPIFAQSSEMAGRDNFQAQQRALIVRLEQQESRLAALEKEIGAVRSQLALQSKTQAPTTPKAIDLRTSPPAVVPSQPSGSTQAYTVRSGDNLVAIARLHGVSVAELMNVNNLNSDRIQIGDQLIIPIHAATAVQHPVSTPDAVVAGDSGSDLTPPPAPPAPKAPASTMGTNYTIASGDTIARVAREHGVSIESIVTANGLRDPNQVVIGQQIVIPSQAPATQPQTTTIVATPSVIEQPPVNRVETVAQTTPKQAPPETSTIPEPTPDNPFPTGYAYYTVVAGDSLYSIAELFGTTQKDLEKLNELKAGGMIHPDQQIVVPMANYKGPFVSN